MKRKNIIRKIFTYISTVASIYTTILSFQSSNFVRAVTFLSAGSSEVDRGSEEEPRNGGENKDKSKEENIPEIKMLLEDRENKSDNNISENPEILIKPKTISRNNISLMSSEETEFICDNIKYKLSQDREGSVVVTGYEDKQAIPDCLYIPESVKNSGETYIVDEIREKSFYNCEKLKGLSIPDSIVFIGKQAFGNSMLKYLMIPGRNIKSIGIDVLTSTPIFNSGDGAAVYTIENAISEKPWENLGIKKSQVRIIPEVPCVENVKYSVKNDNLELSWDVVPKAAGYIITRIGEDKEHATMNTKYTDKLAQTPGSYIYSISAYSNYQNDSADLTDPFKNINLESEPNKISVNFYKVSIESPKYGIITTDQNAAVEGQKIILNVTPNEGYYLSLNSLKINPERVEIIENSDKTFTFTMPAEDVSIIAEFSSELQDDKQNSIPETKPSEGISAIEPIQPMQVDTKITKDISNISNIARSTEFCETSDVNPEMLFNLLLLTISSSPFLLNQKYRHKK